MTPIVSIHAIPCPDPECEDGIILVHNAYNPDPLKPEEQICDCCKGKGFMVHEYITNN